MASSGVFALQLYNFYLISSSLHLVVSIGAFHKIPMDYYEQCEIRFCCWLFFFSEFRLGARIGVVVAICASPRTQPDYEFYVHGTYVTYVQNVTPNPNRFTLGLVS